MLLFSFRPHQRHANDLLDTRYALPEDGRRWVFTEAFVQRHVRVRQSRVQMRTSLNARVTGGRKKVGEGGVPR